MMEIYVVYTAVYQTSSVWVTLEEGEPIWHSLLALD